MTYGGLQGLRRTGQVCLVSCIMIMPRHGMACKGSFHLLSQTAGMCTHNLSLRGDAQALHVKATNQVGCLENVGYTQIKADTPEHVWLVAAARRGDKTEKGGTSGPCLSRCLLGITPTKQQATEL